MVDGCAGDLRSEGGDKKRGEVNEKKITDEDRKLFRRAKEAELQSWQGCRQSQDTPLCLGISRPRLD